VAPKPFPDSEVPTVPAIWDGSPGQIWVHDMGHLVTDDQKAERTHHLDRIGREVLQAVFCARLRDQPATRAASRPSPLRPLPAERCSGVASHEGGETFPVVGAGRRRHLRRERGS